MNWSYPAAIRVLRVMQRNGWTCTAWQCETAYRSAAPHSDVASARELLAALGAEGDPIPCARAGTSEADRDVHLYRLRADCIHYARFVLAYEAKRKNGQGRRPDLEALRGLGNARQATLFNMIPLQP
ncbi:MAG TPA: hypothetical protein VMW48_06490 [Vicinamibacterales bacterium]|nr:hypothetical protein [Armatimonadota bacterium]HUU33693.1 hypothetical protein [Vicinamibacterales bacterium]